VLRSKEWKYVVASIYKCEGLPVMDGKVGMGIATVKQGERCLLCCCFRAIAAGWLPERGSGQLLIPLCCEAVVSS
jgi:hypothetical protein